MDKPSTGLSALSALDWIAVVLVGMGAMFCAAFPFGLGPAYAAMFRDFGSELPAITELALSTWFPLTLAAAPAGALALALGVRLPLGTRRLVIVLGFLLSLAAIGVCLVAVYAPIFALARAVK